MIGWLTCPSTYLVGQGQICFDSGSLFLRGHSIVELLLSIHDTGSKNKNNLDTVLAVQVWHQAVGRQRSYCRNKMVWAIFSQKTEENDLQKHVHIPCIHNPSLANRRSALMGNDDFIWAKAYGSNVYLKNVLMILMLIEQSTLCLGP